MEQRKILESAIVDRLMEIPMSDWGHETVQGSDVENFYFAGLGDLQVFLSSRFGGIRLRLRGGNNDISMILYDTKLDKLIKNLDAEREFKNLKKIEALFNGWGK